jgi:hypothetical protein
MLYSLLLVDLRTIMPRVSRSSLVKKNTPQIVPSVLPLVRTGDEASHVDRRREADRRLGLLPVERLGIEYEAK